MPNSYAQTFPSGTAEHVSTRPLRLTPAAQYSDSDSLPPAAEATADGGVTATPASGLDAPAVTSSSALRALGTPARAPQRPDAVRFDLAVPSQAESKTGFTVNLLADGPGFEKAELDLVLDQPDIQLLKVEPSAGVVVDAKQDSNSLHISIGKAAADGSLAMITLRSDRPSNGPLNLSLQNLKVENEKHAQLASTVALPKQIVVSPSHE